MPDHKCFIHFYINEKKKKNPIVPYFTKLYRCYCIGCIKI